MICEYCDIPVSAATGYGEVTPGEGITWPDGPQQAIVCTPHALALQNKTLDIKDVLLARLIRRVKAGALP